MLVCAGQEPGFKAQRALASGNRVGDDRGVCVADVGPGIHVIDRRGDVELGSIGHGQGGEVSASQTLHPLQSYQASRLLESARKSGVLRVSQTAETSSRAPPLGT